MALRWLSGHRNLALLVALLLLTAAYPALQAVAGSPTPARALLTAVFLAGGWVTLADHRLRAPAAVLGGAALLGAWTGYSLPGEPPGAAAPGFHLTALAFFLFVLVVTLARAFRAPAVTGEVVAAALSGYLLMGFAFAHVYCLLHEAGPGAFAGLDPAPGEYGTYFHLCYFSFVTLTTVGYGDVTPHGEVARSVAVVQAVVGQFYLAVLVAELIGKRVAQALAAAPPP